MASPDDAKAELTSVSSAPTVFVVPVIGLLDMDASANLVTVNQLTVLMEYNDKYEIDLSGASAAALRDSIELTGDAESFGASLKAGNTLTAVLKKVIDEAVKEGAGGKVLSSELYDGLRARFDEYFENGLSNILEESDITHEVHSQAGAESMVGELDAAACEIIAQQIPKDHYTAWSDASENYEGTGLPLLDGDTLVFVFNLTEELTVNRVEAKTGGTTGDAVAGAVTHVGTSGAYTTTKPGTASYIYESRKIAFFVTVTGVNPAGYVAGAGGSA